MKNPLMYQLTKYDCTPTSLLNAIIHLYKREEIPFKIIQKINNVCIDGHSKKGVSGGSGITNFAMEYLNNHFRRNGFNIKSKIIEKDKVIFEKTILFIII